MKEYTPIGESYQVITSSFMLNSLLEDLPKAKAKYGDSVTIRPATRTNGHTNRDWEYSESSEAFFEMVYLAPYYTQQMP